MKLTVARSAAASYAPRQIRVNVVAPGLVKTKLTQKIWESERAADTSRSMHALEDDRELLGGAELDLQEGRFLLRKSDRGGQQQRCDNHVFHPTTSAPSAPLSIAIAALA